MLVNAIVLYAHYDLFSPFFYTIINFWINLVDAKSATFFSRYPGHYLLLPYYFGWAKLLVGLIFEGLVLGLVAGYFYNSYAVRTVAKRFTFKKVFKIWPQLVLGWLVIYSLGLMISLYFPDWFEFLHQYSRRRLFAFNLGLIPLVTSFILALFYFVLPAIVIYGDNFLQAIVRSLKLFIRRPFSTLTLAVTVVIIPSCITGLAGQTTEIVEKFRPELVFWLLLAGLAVELIANFFWIGTAVRFLIDDQDH